MSTITLLPTFNFDGTQRFGADVAFDLDCECGRHTEGWTLTNLDGHVVAPCDHCDRVFLVVAATRELPLAA